MQGSHQEQGPPGELHPARAQSVEGQKMKDGLRPGQGIAEVRQREPQQIDESQRLIQEPENSSESNNFFIRWGIRNSTGGSSFRSPSTPNGKPGGNDGEQPISSSFHGSARSRSEETDLEVVWAKAKESHAVPYLLVCLALCGLSAVVTFGATATDRGLEKAAGRPVISNMFTAAFCFGISDIIAQVIQHKGHLQEAMQDLALGRAMRASLLGLFINGVGYSVWLYFLDKLIPERIVGISSVSSAVLLVGKGCVDSLIWGILSNSVGIIGRRMLEGDTSTEAIHVWHGKILHVTIVDFQFWPMWSVINFQLVPKPLQVSFTAAGAIIWNVYMSLVSNFEKTEHPVAGRSSVQGPITIRQNIHRVPMEGQPHPPHAKEHHSHAEVSLHDWQRIKQSSDVVGGASAAVNDGANGVSSRGYQAV